MAIVIRTSPNSKFQFAADLSSLPAEVSYPGRYGADTSALLFALVWFGVLAAMTVNIVGGEGLRGAIPLVGLTAMFAFGAFMFAGEIVEFFSISHVVYHEDRVEVSEKRLFRTRHWSASYKEYKGVKWRKKTVRSGRLGEAKYQVIELAHPEREKTLPLYVKRSDTAPVDEWHFYADALGLKALEG